jgi:hypothetical protein
LFHTAFASGAAPGFPPFAAVEVRGAESRRPLPDFATNRGLAAVLKAPGWAAAAVAALSPSFEGVAGVAPFAARKVLLTDTGLNDVGFFTADAVRTWPFSSPAVFEVSAFDASVSDPPLTLTSVELTNDSTLSVSGLSSSLSALPFTRGASEGTSWLSVSVGFYAQISKLLSSPTDGFLRTSS